MNEEAKGEWVRVRRSWLDNIKKQLEKLRDDHTVQHRYTSDLLEKLLELPDE